MSIELKYSYKVNITLVKPIVIKKKVQFVKLFSAFVYIVRVKLILAETNLFDDANLLVFSNPQLSVGKGDIVPTRMVICTYLMRINNPILAQK